MNEATREPEAGAAAVTPGADAPLTERAPQGYKAKEQQSEPAPSGRARHLATLAFAVLWLGALSGYLWGYYSKAGAPLPGLSTLALALGAALVPIFIIAVLVELAAQAGRLSRLTRQLTRAARGVAENDAHTSTRIAQTGQAVRRELDVLSAALDATLARVAAVEDMLADQIDAIERAGSQAQQRAQTIRGLLQTERTQLAELAEDLGRKSQDIVQAVGAQSQAGERHSRAAAKSCARPRRRSPARSKASRVPRRMPAAIPPASSKSSNGPRTRLRMRRAIRWPRPTGSRRGSVRSTAFSPARPSASRS